MPIGRLQDRPLHREGFEILRHDVEIVGVGIERRDAHHLALRAVVAVVVVGRHVRDLLLAQYPGKAARQRRLTTGRIADDGEHRRLSHPCAHRCHAGMLAGSRQHCRQHGDEILFPAWETG